MRKVTYKQAGVDIQRGESAVQNIKKLVYSTFTPGVLQEIGGFGGLFEPDLRQYNHPVLVASTDGVGTKLKVAVMAGKHDTVGKDLVNHCVNDIAVCGATPLFFLDYFASGVLDQHIFVDVVKGFVQGCRDNGCALIGGETAEMPEMYRKGEYDICGTVVGMVDRNRIINGQKINKSTKIIGVHSNGLHTNGYSLARKILFKDYKIDSYLSDLNCTVRDALLAGHISYLKLIHQMRDKFDIQGIAHITGGGIAGNSARLLPEGAELDIHWSAWNRPPLFKLLQNMGNVPENDMRATFNLGIGLTVFIDTSDVDDLLELIHQNGHQATIIGQIRL